MKRRIANLKIKHDGTYNSGGYLRQGVTATDDPRTSPGAVHPLVCTHPDTGRRMLYLGRRRNAYLMGLELAESEALLDELWSFVERAGIRLGACLAGRRSRAVGQPLHHASARPVRRIGAADHASHANQGQRGAGLTRELLALAHTAAIVCTSTRNCSFTNRSTMSSVFGGYFPFGNIFGNSRRRNAMNFGMSCECTR